MRRSSLVFVLSLSVGATLLTAAVPAVAGETLREPLRFPGPKVMGLGTGWTIHDTLPNTEHPKPSRSCRVATECSGVRWAYKGADGQQLGIYGSRAYRGSPVKLKAELRMLRRESIDQGIAVVAKRAGKFRHFVFTGTFTSGPYLGQNARFVYTTYRWKRVATIGFQADREFFDSKKRDIRVPSIVATTTRLADPSAGRVSRTTVAIK